MATLAAGLLALPAAAAGGPALAADHGRGAAPAAYDAPLVVTIGTLTPGEVPDRGPIEISGTIINRDVEEWREIYLHAFINGDDCDGCPPPMTTAAELVEAAESNPEDVVGNRITAVTDTVSALAPGAVAQYSITVPRRYIDVSQPGIYWFGVHAIGSSDSSPRDSTADGRARTFLPYVPRGRNGIRGEIDTAVVVPIRNRITHTASGAIARRDEWRAELAPYGDLGGSLDFGAASAGRPLTWVVDPAVPDAARRLVQGNPPRDLGPSGGEDGSDSPAGSPTDGATDGEEPEQEPVAADPIAELAQSWLDELEIQLRGEEVLALPYGDLDVSAAATAAPDLYPLARERAGDVLTDWEIDTTPAVASPGGYVDPSAFDAIADDSTLLLTDRMFVDEEAFPNGPPRVASYDDHTVAVTSYGATTGGPGPDPRLAPVAFRQRVLAEAALRLLTPGGRRPLVVVVPRNVGGNGAAEFWEGLDAEWVRLTTVSEATDREERPVRPDDLAYPAEQDTAELGSSVFYEVGQLIDSGAVLQRVLPESDGLAGEVRDEALAGASYSFRSSPRIVSRNLLRSRQWIERRLGAVRIDAPPGVTLSSADGSFAATVTNRLDRTVTVRIAGSSAGDGVEIDGGDPIVLAANSRTTVFLGAHTSGPGVHNVTLSVTDVDGEPLGSSDRVPIRSGQVSEVIWVIIGAGCGILLLAIALRLYRRIRGSRRADAQAGPA